ncbi:hypothetical protein NQ686_17265 [Acinetobacter baumannii]|nr:hypothetical protein [Acinetobacter baumannii]
MSMKQKVERLTEQVNMLAKVVEDMNKPQEPVCGETIKAHSASIDENVLHRIEDAELTVSAATNVANAAHALATEALNKQNQNQELNTAAFLLRIAQEQGLHEQVGISAQSKLIEVIGRL